MLVLRPRYGAWFFGSQFSASSRKLHPVSAQTMAPRSTMSLDDASIATSLAVPQWLLFEPVRVSALRAALVTVHERFRTGWYQPSPASSSRSDWLPYGNCATAFAAAQIVEGVLMIPEVRLGVKQNPSETFRGSFGTHSTATDHWRRGPRWPARMAPSPAATNTQRGRLGATFVAHTC